MVEENISSALNVTIAELFRVKLLSDFVPSFYGVRHCHLPQKTLSSPPFDWDDLNVTLARHRFLPPRLRLVHSESETLADLQLHAWSGSRSPVSIPSLRPSALDQGLARGGALVLDGVDEISENLRRLAHGLSAALHETVGMNCYASFKADSSFGPHWDEHDVFAYQMCGRKRWRILSDLDISETSPVRRLETTRPERVIDDLVLEEGDVLYIPRGCWHEVVGLDEPSLHISIGVARKRAIDLLRSRIEDLDEHPFWGATIPRFAEPERLKAFEAELGAALSEIDRTPLSVADYLEDSDRKVRLAPVTNLPWTVMGSNSIADDVTITWRGHSGRIVDKDHESASLHINGIELDLSPTAIRVITVISPGPLKFSQLVEAAHDCDSAELKSIVRALARRGLLELTSELGAP